MAITPNSTIKLLKVPFEIDNKNQLTFNNVNEQTNYFKSLPNIEKENCSYQRKDNIIYFPSHIDNLWEYNYVMYQNTNYSNKWFYAYISKMEYNNNGLTNIYIKTDVYQTWQFDIIWKAMFIEREHIAKSQDIIGNYTVPENLETGEYIVDNLTYFNQLDDMRYIIQVTEYSNETSSVPLATNYGGVYVAGRCLYL